VPGVVSKSKETGGGEGKGTARKAVARILPQAWKWGRESGVAALRVIHLETGSGK